MKDNLHPTKKLGDSNVATLIMGQSPDSVTYNREKKGLPFYQGKTDFGLISPTPRVWCSAPLRLAKAGDTLISVRAPVGDVNLASEDCCLGRGIAAARSSSQTNPLFLFFALASVKSQFEALSTGTTFQSVNKTAIENLEIPFPLRSEQEKIAAVLWKIQRAIEVEIKMIAASHELKQSTLRKLFAHGVRNGPQKETEIGSIPESWDLLPLSKICSFASGGTPSKARPDYWKGTIPWASPKDMKKPRLRDVQDHISQAGLEAGSTLVPANSLFVVIRGMILMRDVPVALTEVPMAFNQDMKAILPGERVAADYLLYAFSAFKGMLFQKVGRSAHGTRTLISPELAKFLVPVPPLEDQKEIATILHTIDRKISVHERRRSALSDLFLTLLSQLMTAQIRVDKLDIDTREVTALNAETI